MLGFHLHAFKCSFWKKLIQKPRFYFIDTGIVRALSRTLSQPLTAGSYEFGNIFEQFILVECYKLCQYNWPDYRLSYFRTADGVEVDLVVERPGQPLLLIEIKSISDVQEKHVAPLSKIALELESVSHHGVESICLANIDRPRQLGAVRVIPWQQGIKKYFGK